MLLDLELTAPIIIMGLGACFLLMVEVFAKSLNLKTKVSALSILLSIGSLFYFKSNFIVGATAFSGLIYADPFTWLASLLILGGSFIALLLGEKSLSKEIPASGNEYYSLFMMSISGALIMVAAREMILLFLGLEIMSIALYCLCAFNLWSSRSSEAGLKYFLLGSFSSAIFLYGISLIYGLTGSLVISDISNLLITGNFANNTLLYMALGFMLVGFAFKIGLVPFHFWVPDVYQGAPTPVTAFMACVVKVAAVSVALRGLWVMFGEASIFEHWSHVIWILSVLTMTVGNLVALRQKSVKRMLAYSSIAHAGYMFMAFLAPGFGGGSSIIYYLVAYMVMTFGAFGVIIAVSDSAPEGVEGDEISRFNGVGFSHPVLGILMTIFMFSLAGLPPGLAGFLGKFYIFNSVIQADYLGLVIIAVINSAISCYYYLRVLVAMYFADSEGNQPIELDWSMRSALYVCAIATIFLGIFPSQVYISQLQLLLLFPML